MKLEDIHLSGSEIGAILGFSQWENIMGIYMRKLGMTEPQPENEAMRWGTAAEHVVARRYAKQMGLNLYPSIDEGYDRHKPLIHPEYPWWTGTPDRKIHGPNDDWGLLEIKIIGERSAQYWGEPPDGEVPDSYLCQMAWYFPLINAEWGDLAVQVGNREFRIYRIHRDRELENSMRDAALDFINNHLIPEIPPPIDESERSSMFLARKYPKDEEPLLETTDEKAILLVEELQAVRQILAENTAHEQLLINQIKDYIGPHAGIQGSFGKVLWKKAKDSVKIDWHGVVADYEKRYEIPNEEAQEIVYSHTTTKPGARVFRPYLKEEF